MLDISPLLPLMSICFVLLLRIQKLLFVLPVFSATTLPLEPTVSGARQGRSAGNVPLFISPFGSWALEVHS